MDKKKKKTLIFKRIIQILDKQYPKCDLIKLSKKTEMFTKINGEEVPAKLLPLTNVTTLLEVKISDGRIFRATKGTRKAGSRVGIHVHRYGGYTLVLSGEMTDFVEGRESKKYKSPSGYYMPPCTPMEAANLSDKDAEIIDIFIGDPGSPFIDILEPRWNFERIGRFSK